MHAEQHEDSCWITNSSLVREWERMKDEILRHKWLESEKAGSDVGWEKAYVNWMVRHRPMFPDAV